MSPNKKEPKIKHLLQVPKYSKESKFTMQILVNMHKQRTNMESFF